MNFGSLAMHLCTKSHCNFMCTMCNLPGYEGGSILIRGLQFLREIWMTDVYFEAKVKYVAESRFARRRG